MTLSSLFSPAAAQQPKRRLPRMAISLTLAALATAALMGINELGYQQSTQAVERVSQAQVLRSTINRLLQLILDAETGQRGYLLTGDERYLAPYNDAVAQVTRQLETFRTQYTTDIAEMANYAQLAAHVSHKLEEMELSVKLRKEGNEDAWKFVMLSDVGKNQMDQIRAEALVLVQESTRQLEVAQGHITRSLELSRLGIALTALMALLSFHLYQRQTRALEQAGEREQQALQHERDRLEILVRERTASLAELATHLQQVREDERAHLARELHDELGALLTAAKLDVARIKSRLGPDSPEALERIAHLTNTLNSGIALKRRIIEDLRPSSLSNLGLVASLEILTREFSERAGLPVMTQLEPVTLDDSAQLTLYRLVQESLTNIGKYAQAHQVMVTLRPQGRHAWVEVSDDGVGFAPSSVKTASHGLAGMRHRVEATGGHLDISSAPGQGTRVTAQLPLSET